MALPGYGVYDGDLPPELFAEQQRLGHRQRIAEAMIQRGATPVQSSNPRSPVSWTQGLAQILNAYKGGKALEGVEQGQQQLGQQYQQGLASEVQRIAKMRQGQMIAPDPQEHEQAADQGTPEPQMASTGDPRAAIQEALVSQYAPVRQMGAMQHKTFENEQTRAADREARLHERILALDAAAQNHAISREDRAAAGEQARELRLTLQKGQQSFAAQQNQMNRDQRREDLELRLADQRDAAMERIRMAAEAKTAAAAGKQDEAKQRMSSNMGTLASYYEELDRLGSSKDTRKGVLGNLWASARASGAGQAFERAIGTETQAWRDSINQMRPLLLQDIRQASAMGARGLDSNKELEFYLQAATDPSRDRVTNKAAMTVLDRAYGLGTGVTTDEAMIAKLKQEFVKAGGGAPANPPQPAAPAGGPPRISSDAEFDALPSGTEFIAPDGSTRRKP